ncbi:MAG: hypothetical protein PUP91_15510 [Rhizonema sp. PD37]|nr:hypothetical protein [Rhizonema sp. PD37]
MRRLAHSVAMPLALRYVRVRVREASRREASRREASPFGRRSPLSMVWFIESENCCNERFSGVIGVMEKS